MKYSAEFENYRDIVPEYKVFPVTENPVVFKLGENALNLTWQVGIVPAFDMPNEKFFDPVGYQYDVLIRNLIGVREDKANFYHMLKQGIKLEDRFEQRRKMREAIQAMGALVNHTLNPHAIDELLYYQRELPSRDIFK